MRSLVSIAPPPEDSVGGKVPMAIMIVLNGTGGRTSFLQWNQ